LCTDEWIEANLKTSHAPETGYRPLCQYIVFTYPLKKSGAMRHTRIDPHFRGGSKPRAENGLPHPRQDA
jgi:hypothetical protein